MKIPVRMGVYTTINQLVGKSGRSESPATGTMMDDVREGERDAEWVTGGT